MSQEIEDAVRRAVPARYVEIAAYALIEGGVMTLEDLKARVQRIQVEDVLYDMLRGYMSERDAQIVLGALLMSLTPDVVREALMALMADPSRVEEGERSAPAQGKARYEC